MARTCGVLCILICRCASRHSGVQFFETGNSKIGPALRCFAHFDLQMCFAPQRRAIFQIGTSTNAPRLEVYQWACGKTRWNVWPYHCSFLAQVPVLTGTRRYGSSFGARCVAVYFGGIRESLERVNEFVLMEVW